MGERPRIARAAQEIAAPTYQLRPEAGSDQVADDDDDGGESPAHARRHGVEVKTVARPDEHDIGESPEGKSDDSKGQRSQRGAPEAEGRGHTDRSSAQPQQLIVAAAKARCDPAR